MAIKRTIGPQVAPLGETETDYFGNGVADLAKLPARRNPKLLLKKKIKAASPFGSSTPTNAPLMQKMMGNEPGGPTNGAASGSVMDMDQGAWKKLLAKFGVSD